MNDERPDENVDAEIDKMIMDYAATIYRFREAKRRVLERIRRQRQMQRPPEPN